MRLLRALGLPSCLFAAAACSVTFPTSSAWVSDCGLVEHETSTLEQPLTVTPEMGPVVVRLVVDGRSGAAKWSLVDPDGVVRWRCSSEPAGHVDEQVELPLHAGTWSVRREWSDFTGSQWLCVNSASASTVTLEVTGGSVGGP
jgi:hypothetical protein